MARSRELNQVEAGAAGIRGEALRETASSATGDRRRPGASCRREQADDSSGASHRCRQPGPRPAAASAHAAGAAIRTAADFARETNQRRAREDFRARLPGGPKPRRQRRRTGRRAFLSPPSSDGGRAGRRPGAARRKRGPVLTTAKPRWFRTPAWRPLGGRTGRRQRPATRGRATGPTNRAGVRQIRDISIAATDPWRPGCRNGEADAHTGWSPVVVVRRRAEAKVRRVPTPGQPRGAAPARRRHFKGRRQGCRQSKR